MNTQTKQLPFKLSLARGWVRQRKILEGKGFFLEHNGTKERKLGYGDGGGFFQETPEQTSFYQRVKRGFPPLSGWRITDIGHVTPYHWDMAWEDGNVVVTETGPFLHLPERSMEILASFNIGQSQTGTWRTLPENVSQRVVGKTQEEIKMQMRIAYAMEQKRKSPPTHH